MARAEWDLPTPGASEQQDVTPSDPAVTSRNKALTCALGQLGKAVKFEVVSSVFPGSRLA